MVARDDLNAQPVGRDTGWRTVLPQGLETGRPALWRKSNLTMSRPVCEAQVTDFLAQ